MCVTAALAIGSLAMSAYSADQQSKAVAASAAEARVQGAAAMYEGAYDREMRQLEARDTMAAANEEYDQIRQHAYNLRSAAITAQSGSGVAIGEGSAQAAVDQIETLATADALAALYSGINKSLSIREQGRVAGEQGRQALVTSNRRASSIQSAADAAATGTLLGGAIQAAGGLHKAYKAGWQ